MRQGALRTRLWRWVSLRSTHPTGLLLFTAFITPFIDPQHNLMLQAGVLVLTYAVVEFAVKFGVASAANRVRPWLARAGRRFNRVYGGPASTSCLSSSPMFNEIFDKDSVKIKLYELSWDASYE